MNILCTGHLGFVGREVSKLVLERGHTLTGCDNHDPQVHNEEAIMSDMTCADFPWTGEIDVVIHLAAKVGVGQSMYQQAEYIAQNSWDTARFLSNMTSKPPKLLVVASSMSVYGEGMEMDGVTEEYPIDIRSVYALTKYDQEQLCLMWGKANGVKVVALRFFNIYGPGQSLRNPYTGALAIFANRLLNDKPPIIFDDGNQTRDFIYVTDIAEAVMHAAEGNMISGIYNVGTGNKLSIHFVALMMAKCIGKEIQPTITKQKRVGDIRHCFASIKKILSTGWRPKVTFHEGAQRYADWLKQQPIPEDRSEQAIGELVQNGLLK